MADNLSVTAGSGSTIGMDEVVDGTLGTVKVGYGKIMDGTLDSTNKLIVNADGEALTKDTDAEASLTSIDGKITAVDTGAVTVASSALPTGGATSAKQDTGNTSLGNIDTATGAISDASVSAGATGSISAKLRRLTADTDSIKTAVTGTLDNNQTKIAGTPVDTNSGTKSAGTQRVVLATDQPQLTNALKVDGSAVTQPVSLTSTTITGTVTANIGTSGSLALDATLTGGTQKTKITDGTNETNVLKSDGTASGQNSLLIGGANLEVSFTTTTAQAVGATDVKNYRSVSVHVVSQGGSSSVFFQGSNNNTDWVNVSLTNTSATTGSSPATSTSSASVIWAGSLNYRYFRLNITGIVSGTTAGVIEFGTQPLTLQSVGIASGTVTVNDAPITTGGLSKSHLVSGASTNATNVKASAGQVYTITAFNTNASPRYLKFHNTAGTPTAGTAVTDTFLVPGNASDAGLVLNIDKGIAFSTGIAFTTVTGIADADSTGVGSGDLVINIYYK